MIRVFAISDVISESRHELEEAEKILELQQSIRALMENLPGMSFSKDGETGEYLACNQGFAEYAHRESPEEVVGLTDFDIFDPKTAAHFVEDDIRLPAFIRQCLQPPDGHQLLPDAVLRRLRVSVRKIAVHVFRAGPV